MAQSILYYPSISIDDGSWLRSAVLYWDEICSIVPYEGYDRFSPEVMFLRERGQYRPIYPKNVFTLSDPSAFAKAANRYLKYSGVSHNRMIASCSRTRRINDPSLNALIHYKKLPQKTIEMLLKQGIKIDCDGWIEMPADTLRGYMRLLAEFAAKSDDHDVVIGTDTVASLHELYPRMRAKKEGAISVVLEKCFPIPAMDVGFEELLDFKARRKDELLEIRRKIRELEEKTASCESERDINATLEAFREDWQKELADSEKLFKDSRIKMMLGGLKSFIKGGIEMAEIMNICNSNGLMSIPGKTIGLSMGISGMIGAAMNFIAFNDRIRPDRHNGFAYLISARKHGIIC